MYPYISFLNIPTYFLIISLDCCLCLIWVIYRAKIKGLDKKSTLDISLILMLLGLIGGRGFHILFENPDYYLKNPIEAFNLLNGGFVYYGGLILATLTALVFVKYQKAPLLKNLDLFAPIGAVSYAIGRWGCFFAGCCYGRTCELPWAISGLHPTALYASTWEFGTLLILLGLEKKKMPLKDGSIFFSWLSLHAVGRLIVEQFRADFRGPIYFLSISSWISLFLLIIPISGFVYLGRKKTIE